MKLANCIGESECDSKGDDRPDYCINQNVGDVFTKVLLLEIVASCEDHGREEPVEEYLLAELQFFDIDDEVEEEAEYKSNEDACSCFVDEVELG